MEPKRCSVCGSNAMPYKQYWCCSNEHCLNNDTLYFFEEWQSRPIEDELQRQIDALDNPPIPKPSCACCDRIDDGMKTIEFPSFLKGKKLCKDCCGIRACLECGHLTDSGDLPPPAEVSFCSECRSVESLTDVEYC